MRDPYDVMIAGGGPGGCAAAIAAGRAKARTLLIERYGCLGGMATIGLVNPFMPFSITHPETGETERISAGIFSELLDVLEQHNALQERAFDEEILKIVLDGMMEDAGVDTLLHALVVGVRMEGERIRALEVETKSGRLTVEGAVFVDATGDGDLAAFAGAPFEVGRSEDGLPQAMTTCFNMSDVEVSALMRDGFAAGRRYVNRKFREAQKRGRLADVPIGNFRWYLHPRPGVLHFNVTRVTHRFGTSVEDLAAAEIEARRQIDEIWQWLVEEVEPFRHAWLSKIATQIGVRESRRILGDYVIDQEDILEATKFPDAVMRGCYGIDIHNPTEAGCKWRSVKRGEAYEVPYRAITPRKTRNLLMSCRALSATHEAHAAIRVMPQMFTLGHAAGLAAAMAARGNGDVREVDTNALQDRLIEEGANLIKHGTA